MPNTINDRKHKSPRYELTFWGGVPLRVRRYWPTYDAAEARAKAVLATIDNRAAHPAIIYGPGCGRDGVTIR
jgi:hypothetical protein